MTDLDLIFAWSEPLLRAAQIVIILLLAWAGLRLLVRSLERLGQRYPLPSELLLPLGVALRWLIVCTALILILERLGVSATVLWSALTGFAAVGAVAFFAMWSVLSNLFCAVLIFTVGPFRLGDRVEVLDSPDQPGMKGRVVAINLLYTTLREAGDTPGTEGAQLQVPNSLFFQKAVRRWRGPDFTSLR
ncbi:MAG: hypothetical protein GAK45_02316 [Pseudomonas citronellolis]|nr:MAG: hypothetical protein GAK45_02316 [Pseudomonas citronellolis]